MRTRGTAPDILVEAIDLAPTFLEWAGGAPEPERLEGRSLVGILDAPSVAHPPGASAATSAPEGAKKWREAVFCDSDFALRHARRTLGLGVDEARGFMVRTARWKYVHFVAYPPQLFDLDADPAEQADLGCSAAHEAVRREMQERLMAWALARRTRLGVTDAYVEASTGAARKRGYRFGEW